MAAGDLAALVSWSLVSLSTPAAMLWAAAVSSHGHGVSRTHITTSTRSSSSSSSHQQHHAPLALAVAPSHYGPLVRCAMALFPAALPIAAAAGPASDSLRSDDALPFIAKAAVAPPAAVPLPPQDDGGGGGLGGGGDIVFQNDRAAAAAVSDRSESLRRRAFDDLPKQRLFRRESGGEVIPPGSAEGQQKLSPRDVSNNGGSNNAAAGGVLPPQKPLDAGVPVPPQPAEVQAALDSSVNVKNDASQQVKVREGEVKVEEEDPVARLAHNYGIDDVSKLTPEQRHTLEDRVKFEAEHKGHERQHAQMAIILMVGLLLFQFVLLGWKKLHPRSYQLASLIGLWIVPPGIGLSAGNYRYVFAWVCFSVVNLFVVRRALFETPMQSSTPKLVYKWYSYVYNASVAVGFVGYVIVIVTFFHLPYALLGFSEKSELSIFQGGVITLFYGLYFGTLGRDFVDRLSDRMAIRTGYFNKTGFPKKHLRPNVCAICGDSTDVRKSSPAAKLHKLACDHTYHEECIRGWTIVGKKDCCPYCKEKVDLKAFSRHAWDTTQLLYLNLLDGLRYLIVWNPILFLLMHLIFNVLGYK